MKKYATVLLAFLLLLGLTLSAQDITLFNSDNSDLYYNSVYCIDFDQNDNIWFGGQQSAATGLARVCMLAPDLTTWTVYEPADLALTNLEEKSYYIAEDNQGTMWFCTHYGVSYRKSDGTSGEVDFTVDHYTRTVQVDPKGTIYISDRTDEGIWISNDNGESWDMWTREDIGMTLGRPEIYDLREDSQGQLWICTWYGLVYRNTDSTWVNLTATEDLYTYAMTIDNNDHLWVPISGNNELYQIKPDESIVIHDSTAIDILKYDINDLEADDDGYLWLATDGGGLAKLDPTDGTFVSWDSASTAGEIPEDNLTHLELKDGVIWASTATEGILRISGLIETAIDGQLPHQPVSHFKLHNNYPNPFNPETNIVFDLAKAEEINLSVFDIQGKLVSQLASGNYTAGNHAVKWDGLDMSGNKAASGVYIYRLSTSSQQISKKMLMVK